MTQPTPLEVAAALRSAAEFCRDPDSPKCHGALSKDSRGLVVPPTDPRAVAWCAEGHVVLAIGLPFPAIARLVGADRLWRVVEHFDADEHAQAAAVLDRAAAKIEASLPVAPALSTREQVTA